MSPRHQAREAALQILYFWEISRATPDDAIAAFFAEHQPDAPEAVRAFTAEIVQGTIGEIERLDRLIEQHSQHWRLERLAIIDRLVLRMAVWELQHGRDTPAAVVLNEAIELARTFSGDEAVPFVNGVLDGVRKALCQD
jgi:N utilization substance protein B